LDALVGSVGLSAWAFGWQWNPFIAILHAVHSFVPEIQTSCWSGATYVYPKPDRSLGLQLGALWCNCKDFQTLSDMLQQTKVSWVQLHS